MTIIWYYVLPMLLGRTYDVRTNSPGVDIFPQEAIDNATVIRRHFTDSQYRMVTDTQEARDFLGVSGELSLKIKTGKVQIEGLGQYLKETYSRSKVVEILVKVHYETETLTLPSTAEPRPGWRTLDRRSIGTHYVRSITYGGDLVASLRFTAKNTADREKIRAVVQANLQADSGSFGLGIEGNFSRLQEDLKDSSTLEINYYATVPIKGVPNTMESLMELVEDFPAQTQLVNKGVGVPLNMELFPLSALDSDLPRYIETKALVDQLDLIESQFDDIRATKKSFQEWLMNVPPILTQEMEDEIGRFNDELERISLVFYKVLGNLDLGEGANVAQFREAFDAYEGDGGSLPDKYYRKYLLLRHKIMIIRLMYVLPMLLGRTYDVTKNSVGVDIFSPDTISKPRIIQESFYRSSYKTVETNSDVKEVLEINGDLSLAIKAGMFKFRGVGSYLKERMDVQNSVDILTKVSFRTVSKSLDFSARPVPLWFTTAREYLGTHFVRSVLYGGDLIASVRFKAVKSEYLQDIRATIKASLEGGSALDLVGEGKLETLDKKLEKKANMEINYYATVPLEGVPNTIKGLRELVRNFEKHVAKENDGLGVPVEVELEELASLNQTFSYIKNTDLETELGFFEEYLDDLLTTKSRLRSWISSFEDSSISEEQEKQISSFNERLLLVLRKFIDTVASLNLEKGPSQLDEAKEAYKEGRGLGMAGKFRRDLNRLMKKIVPPKRFRDLGSKVYTHFGSKECVGDTDTSTVFSGYLASSPRNATGSGFNYLCMPKVPETSSDVVLVEGMTSNIVGVKYGLLDAMPFKTEDDMVLRGAVCAVCLVKQRPSIFTFMGQSDCPAEKGWALQYSGFMMSSVEVNSSENICVDSKLQWHRDSEMGYYDQSLSFVLAQQNEEHTFIPCAVCSK